MQKRGKQFAALPAECFPDRYQSVLYRFVIDYRIYTLALSLMRYFSSDLFPAGLALPSLARI
jgi:hypothetical protein